MSRGISQIQIISRNETSDSLYADDKLPFTDKASKKSQSSKELQVFNPIKSRTQTADVQF
jgi:hypothetical protein